MCFGPLYLMVPIPFLVFAHFMDIELEYKYVLFGALGWWMALLLRLPVIFLIKNKNLNLKTSSKLTIGLSGRRRKC